VTVGLDNGYDPPGDRHDDVLEAALATLRGAAAGGVPEKTDGLSRSLGRAARAGGHDDPVRVEHDDRRDVGRYVEQIADGLVAGQNVLRAVRCAPYTTRLSGSLTPRP
jgi:hypothetical protein